ncbi:zinc transport system permease protein [Pullulanibacillus pueri]|uniref:Zinc ABC transporter permease n=1 Tax=Pullulanibacillus pueri TaxID=1437324 RepID=A0A8J2ZTU4_9BACL|nr:metal ABC transporter permease [Pullulanibacillus pueri]MBM7681176.1 zinc transport system permease protein [Pullulanibacillus pueri]GGH77345.1 zinc ABC transporter permease [Pullulanibacillus pueri]
MNIEFTHEVLIYAIVGGIMASIISGIIGIVILEKRMVMMSGGVAHTAIGGMGLGYFFNFSPMLGAVVISVLASLGIGRFQRRNQQHTDVLIGVFWAMSMALGVLLMDISGQQVEFEEYLFGNIFSITPVQLWIFAGLLVLILLIFGGFYHAFKVYLFDEEFATVQGLNVRFLETILFIVLGLTTILLIKIVGMLLIVALYSAPPAIAKKFSRHFSTVILTTILLNLIFVIIGVVIAFQLKISSGTSIIFITGLTYFAVVTGEAIHKKKKARQQALVE